MVSKSNLVLTLAITLFLGTIGFATASPAPASDLCFLCQPAGMQPGAPEVCVARPWGRTVCEQFHGGCCLSGGYCYPLM